MVRRGQLYARTENGFVYVFSEKPQYSSETAPGRPLGTQKQMPSELAKLSRDYIEASVAADLEQKRHIFDLEQKLAELETLTGRQVLEIKLLKQEIEDLETLNNALLQTSGRA